ncbi:MAG TPA: EAL domain-containing protein [Noviherbaspirillum sp.]|nr:EAL domain-containing protein [Noviherbaspirillum sp.]
MTTKLHIGEEPIRQLADANIIGMYCWDIHGNIIDTNEAFCQITGYTQQALLSGKVKCADLTAPEFRPMDLQAFDELKQTGSVMPYEKEFVRSDGTRIGVMVGATFFSGSQEQGIAFVLSLEQSKRMEVQPDSAERFRKTVEAALDVIFILDEDGKITYVNPSVEHIVGYPPAELVGHDLTLLMPQRLRDESTTVLKHYLGSEQETSAWDRIEATALHKEGREILLEISLGKFQHSGSNLFAGIMRDITEHKKTQLICNGQNRLLEMIALGAPVEEVLEKLIRLIESQTPGMLGSVLLLNEDGLHVRHGAAPTLPSGYIQAIDGEPIGPRAGSCGTAMYRGKPVITTDILTDPLWTNYRGVAIKHGLRACWSTPIFSSTGKTLGSFAMYYLQPRSPRQDDLRLAELASHVAGIAIERKENENRIHHMAHHDALTGLPNRTLLEESLNQALARASRNHILIALLFIDLDNFKRINDSLGHHVGDLLLQGVARRLQGCLRKDDMLVRLGGDEFVILLSSLHHSGEAALVAGKALKALEIPFDAEAHVLHASGSIGISLYPSDGENAAMLMQAADTAMYHAKENGRGNYQFFTHDLNVAIQHRLTLENQLRQAIANRNLMLNYQPQVDMQSGHIFSAEALARWHHAERGMVPPEQFISIAEESGLILQIGEWVLREACAQLARWRADGQMNMGISINLSARQLFQPGLSKLVAQVVQEFNVPASALDLEITETVLMQPGKENITTLMQLNEMGIQLSIDDFGIGYSSLSYLKRFPIHALKIDRSFVSGIGKDQNDMAITSAIIGMAQGLHLKVIAEGVETAEQASFLKSIGCMSAQGYYYSKPLAPAAFSKLLHSRVS